MLEPEISSGEMPSHFNGRAVDQARPGQPAPSRMLRHVHPATATITPGSALAAFTVGPSVDIVINLLIGTCLSILAGWHFVRFGSTFSNRRKFAVVLPPLALITVLVISVVKVSLALSLGLVGALSIVRFRTPVKEPEELVYLFMAIGIGLGLGANQRVVTIIAFLFILALLTVRSLLRKNSRYPNLYLNVELPPGGSGRETLEALVNLLSQHASDVDLRRVDIQGDGLHATFYLECKNTEELIAIQETLRKAFPKANLSFVEQSSMPGG